VIAIEKAMIRLRFDSKHDCSGFFRVMLCAYYAFADGEQGKANSCFS